MSLDYMQNLEIRLNKESKQKMVQLNNWEVSRIRGKIKRWIKMTKH